MRIFRHRTLARRAALTALALVLAALPSSVLLAGRADVGGHRLWYSKDGRGTPVVVFDAGLGDDHRVWDSVAPAVAELTRVLVYDRAGLGRSADGPDPRSCSRAAEELHALLQRARLEPPYLLVGHSAGGLNLRMFASLYPEEVVGLVLVDATPLGFPAAREEMAGPREHARFETVMAAAPRAVRREYAALPTSVEELGAASVPRELPVVVISAGRPDERPQFRESWGALQEEMAQRVGAREHIVVEESGHYLQHDAPEVIVAAIEKLLKELR